MSALVSITDPQVFAEKMQQIADDPEMDTEQGHVRADALMCELLKKLGYEDGVAIYEAMSRWYA